MLQLPQNRDEDVSFLNCSTSGEPRGGSLVVRMIKSHKSQRSIGLPGLGGKPDCQESSYIIIDHDDHDEMEEDTTAVIVGVSIGVGLLIIIITVTLHLYLRKTRIKHALDTEGDNIRCFPDNKNTGNMLLSSLEENRFYVSAEDGSFQRQCSVKDDANKKAFEKNINKETKMEMIKNSLISGDSSKANSSLPKVKQLSALHYDRRYDNDNEDDEDNDNDDDNVFRYERGLDSFSVGHILGEGMFGTVFLGSASNIYGPQTTKVVVKQVKDVLKADDSQMDAVIAEMKIMSNLNMHPNLVNLLGACTSELCYNKISLLLEFCPYGDLKQFLVEHRGQFESCLRSEPGKLSLSCHTSCHTSCHRPPGEPVQLAPAAPVESRHRQGPGLPHLRLHHARRPRRQERPDRGELCGQDQ